MSNGEQGNGAQGGSQDSSNLTIGPVPDLIATPPPSRDHLIQLVFPGTTSQQKDSN